MKSMSTWMSTVAQISTFCSEMRLARKLLATLLIFSMLLGSPVSATPVVQANNDDPIPAEVAGWVVVETAEQLAYINRHSANYVDRNIRLTNDIDMTGYEWIPFGDEAVPFSGVFDGRGHQIIGLTIDGGTLQFAGFFGRVIGTIQNLGVSVHVSGGINLGGLVGYLNGGSIIQSYSRGTVNGENSGYAALSVAGGLVGVANGHSTIIRSNSTASVKSGEASNQYAGGLVGSQGAGTIQDSYATGAVAHSGSNNYVFAGGLTGQLIYGTISNSYAAGSVTSAEHNPNSIIGGFVGINTLSSIVASYFDNNSTGQSNGIGGGGGISQLIGLSTTDMKLESSYGEEWDFTNTWAIQADVNAGYPYFKPQILTDELPRAIKDAPYSIKLEAFDGSGAGLSWSASGLPQGLELTADGILQGTPVLGGAFTVTVSATDIGMKTISSVLTLYIDEYAPNIIGFAISPGNEFGTTRVTADTGDQGYTFAYVLGSDTGERPLLGDSLSDTVTLYTLGTDIAAVSPGQFLHVYELDHEQRIHAWSSIELAESHIQDQIRVTGVSLDKTELTLIAGGPPQKLNATIEPGNATNQTVTWSSSDSGIAEVNLNGEVTPISAGTATITVTTQDGAHTATATVTVHPAPPTSGTITGTVYGNGDKPLAGAKVSVGDGSAEGGNVETTTDAAGSFVLENIAAGSYSLTLTGAGYIEFKTTVNVVAGEITDVGKIELTTAPIAVTGVSLDKTELTLIAGGPLQKLNATVEPGNATNQTVTWSSSDSRIAVVNPNGEVTPISEGTATITVTTQDGAYTATAMVTVQPAPPTVGTITGTVYGEEDIPLAGAKVSVGGVSVGFSSAGEGNVETKTVTDAAGSFVLENIAEGSYPLTVTATGYIEYKTTVNVVAGETTDIGRIELTIAPVVVTGVSLDKTELTLVAGGLSQKLTATVEPRNATNQLIIWSSSDSGIAEVNQNGEVTPISEGTATITVTTQDGAHTATAMVTVQPAPPTVGTITGIVYGEGEKPLTGAKVSVGGVSVGFSSAGEGNVETKTVTDAAGSFVLENIAEGSYSLTVTVAGYIEYKTTVNVIAGETTDIGRIELTTAPVAVTGVSLDKTELTLVDGGPSQKLTATIEPGNATNQTVTWSSSDSRIAVVNLNGEVTPISEGTATITVTTLDGAHTATAMVTVQPAPPTVGTITGIVYGERDKPLAGAKVSVGGFSAGGVSVGFSSAGEGNVETVTDAAGSFVLENIAEGSYPLTVTATGYIEYKTTVNVVAGETTDIGRIELTTAPVAVTGVSLDKTELTLVAGGPPQKLTATLEPGNATNQLIIWSSSDSGIAEVNQNGEVTPISEGTATITVTTLDGAHTVTAMVTVQPTPPTVGTITGIVYGEGEKPLTGAKVSVGGVSVGFSSAGEGNVETVTDAAGSFVLENIAEGSYSLTVTVAGYIEYKTTVNVIAGVTTDIGRIELTTSPIAVTGVNLDKTELTLVAGGPSQNLTATIEPGNATNQTVTWNSSDPSIAEVDQQGKVTPISEGTATITVTTQDGAYTASATVTVQPAPPTVGAITGRVYDEGDNPLASAKVAIGGSKVEVLTDFEGEFTLNNIAEGSHTLTITSAGYKEHTVTVNVIAGKTTEVERIVLQAVTSPGPSPGWSDPPAPAEDNETMAVAINGLTVQVTAKKEQDRDGRFVLRLVMDAELIQSWFTSPEEIVIAIDNKEPIVKIDLPAKSLKALSEAQPDKLVRIGVNSASYSLPLHSLQHVPNSATITAAIATMPDSDIAELEAAINKQGYTMLVKPMSFYLLSNNKEIIDVQDMYMERTFSLDTEIQANRSTVVKVEDNGRLQFVPSVFETGEAAFYTAQNGWFTAIATERAFSDTKGHWAQAEIELLASKLIVNGSANNTFNPERSITRAEFAALLVRALGLTEKPQHASYSDIPSEAAWYVGAIGAAAAAGLVEGFSDDTFRPNALITREQMVVMLGRAIRYAGELPAATAENSLLESFTDHSELADWAEGDAAQLLAAGIIEGTEYAAFAPKEPATRAQSAVLLVRMLRYLDFINE